MTKRERAILREAVRLLWQGDEETDGFEKGIRLLLPLAGMRIPALELIDGTQLVTLADVLLERAPVTDLAEPIDSYATRR